MLLDPAQVEREAGMLDYFLKYLTGSERRRLVIRVRCHPAVILCD